MTSLEAALRRIDRDLAEARHPFALVGGLAVSARTEPRFTRDADLAVAVGSDAEAEALVLGLRTSGYRIASVLEHETAGRVATVRLAPTGQQLDRLGFLHDLGSAPAPPARSLPPVKRLSGAGCWRRR